MKADESDPFSFEYGADYSLEYLVMICFNLLAGFDIRATL
jgi:hypothetical protein